MKGFDWPDHIRFDDSEEDINEARRVWLNARGELEGGGHLSDFLEFMHVYASELDRRRSERGHFRRLA